ncbi:hypothetical protein D7316_02254 [Gordonia insulae]|uniref:Uncharacterized protein n=2 Tax=Gordonia insulae TaxID=2420509 RepID=A0A3G8JKQ7_9ACTN|nr:hypothetical protein D7316_02254 [Gordonia insulae]
MGYSTFLAFWTDNLAGPPSSVIVLSMVPEALRRMVEEGATDAEIAAVAALDLAGVREIRQSALRGA